MHFWSLVFTCVLVLCGFVPCLAQQPTGPATLEGLLNSDKARKPAAAAEADVTPKRPAGTVARPEDGVKHPDLDKAWAEYGAAVARATEGVKTAIAKQFDAATAKGDLDAAEKWQVIGEKFEKAGELPAETETKEAVSAAVADYKKAINELTMAYEAVVKNLTMEKKIADAKAVRGESLSILVAKKDEAGVAREQQNAGRKDNAIFLSDLQENGVFVGYGSFGKNDDLGYEEKKICVSGRDVKKGLSMHPPNNGASAVTYTVPEGCTHFEARAAMNDSAIAQRTPVVFGVMSGKRVLWQSRPIGGAGVGEDCAIPLKGAKTVTLIVNCPGVFACAHAVWIDPRFLRK